MKPLGHESIGHGAQHVIVLHDWMGDHRNYEPMLPYLDRAAFTYALTDLRGYGLSRERSGRCDLQEAAEDVLALATDLGWSRFDLLGHSMSTLVAQQVAASAPERVGAMVLLTPIAPTGMGAPDDVIEYLEKMARDEAVRREGLAAQWGDRLSRSWLDFKLERWSQSADAETSRAYVRMFATAAISGLPRTDLPVLAVVGDRDNEPFQEQTVREGFSKIYSRLELFVCSNAGHYPMQETPVALATAIERFFRTSMSGR